jgi:hypothetical protein
VDVVLCERRPVGCLDFIKIREASTAVAESEIVRRIKEAHQRNVTWKEHADAQAAYTSGPVLTMRQRALLETSAPMQSVELIRPMTS